MTKQPLYPHVPKSRRTEPRRDELRFLPDNHEVLAQTVNNTGCRDKLECAFQEAIKRARGVK